LLGVSKTRNTFPRTSYPAYLILGQAFFFILVEVALAIAFGTTNFKDKYNAAGVLEWAIAFVFTFYVFSFIIDLAPAVSTKHARFGNGGTQMQMEANDGVEGRDNIDDAGYRQTGDSQRTLAANDVRRVGGKEGVTPLGQNF